MPNRCVVAGCSNLSDPEKGISLHLFPKDPYLRNLWASKVRLTRSKWNGPSKTSVICSDHFTDEDFVPTSGLYAAVGLSMKRSLKPGAVPHTGKRSASELSSETERPLTKWALKRRKTEREQIVNELIRQHDEDQTAGMVTVIEQQRPGNCAMEQQQPGPSVIEQQQLGTSAMEHAQRPGPSLMEQQRPGINVMEQQQQQPGPSVMEQQRLGTSAMEHAQRPGPSLMEQQRPGINVMEQQQQQPGPSVMEQQRLGTSAMEHAQRPGPSVMEQQRLGTSAMEHAQRPGPSLMEQQRPGINVMEQQQQQPGHSLVHQHPWTSAIAQQQPRSSLMEQQRPGTVVMEQQLPETSTREEQSLGTSTMEHLTNEMAMQQPETSTIEEQALETRMMVEGRSGTIVMEQQALQTSGMVQPLGTSSMGAQLSSTSSQAEDNPNVAFSYYEQEMEQSLLGIAEPFTFEVHAETLTQDSRTVGTQFLFTPSTRVKRIQVNVSKRDMGTWIEPVQLTSTATQCKIAEEIPLEPEEGQSDKGSSSESDEPADDEPKKKDSSPEYSPESSSSSSKEQSTPRKKTPTKKQKRSRGQQPRTTWQRRSIAPHEDQKYVVFESQLMELFQHCPSCGSASMGIQKWTKGTLVVISRECWSCQAPKTTWASQPWYGNTPAGNVLLGASTLFAGGSPAKMIRILKFFKVAVFEEQTFFRFQRDIFHPAIETKWEEQQSLLLSSLVAAGKTLTIGGDGRADSPGHSAKYGMYTAIDLEGKKIVDMQLVQSNEVKNSYHMEMEGFRRMTSSIERSGLQIGKLVTDRHRGLAKHVRETMPQVKHMFDVWHVAKAVRKKVHALAKQKECEVVGKWEASINNHAYWVASSTKDDEEEMREAKWKSLENHVQGIHSGHSELFPKCLHGDIDEGRPKKWLKSSTLACEKLGDIITNTTLVKDIRKLSSGQQTSSLESFHSLVNQFAPKMKSYGYFGMTSRIRLAAMHFNENSNRDQATTSTGEKRYQVSKPKYKEGKATVKPIKEDAKFGYVADLMGEVATRAKTYKHIPKKKAAHSTHMAPPPLSSRYSYPTKDQLVKEHRSRFNLGNDS